MDSIQARALHDPQTERVPKLLPHNEVQAIAVIDLAVEQTSATASAAAEFHAPCIVAHLGSFNCKPE